MIILELLAAVILILLGWRARVLWHAHREKVRVEAATTARVDWAAVTVSLRTATDDQITRLKNMSEDDLLRSAASLDLFAVVESNRRLRVALHKEEWAIKWLTAALVGLTAALVYLGLETLRRPT